MRFTIVPPEDSGKEPYQKEFASWAEVDKYLLSKNDEHWRADTANEVVSFPLGVID